MSDDVNTAAHHGNRANFLQRERPPRKNLRATNNVKNGQKEQVKGKYTPQVGKTEKSDDSLRRRQ